MKLLFKVILIILLISNKSFAKAGKGELKLDKYTLEQFLIYIYAEQPDKNIGNNLKANPLVFSVDENGWSSMYYYCNFDQCLDANVERQAKLGCEKSSNFVPCWTFARKKRVVWKNSINKKNLNLSPYIKQGKLYVAKILQEKGFYDGDIYELEGIKDTIEKNEIINNNQTDISSTNNNKSLSDQIKDLKDLYDSGALTKEEFEKAKKKILN